MIKNKKRLVINIMAIFLVVFLIRIYIDNNVFEAPRSLNFSIAAIGSINANIAPQNKRRSYSYV